MLTEDRNTPMSDDGILEIPAAANAVGFAGGIAVANASGFGAKGTTALNLTYLGRIEAAFDNTGGADGAVTMTVRRNKSFEWKNSGTDAVTQASLGKVCYIEDDETVAATDGAGTRSACGVVVSVSANRVWVK